MNLTLETSISALAVFTQGILSFFSPCVLPLIPLYIGYLSGGARSVDAEGNTTYHRGTILRNTFFFVLGTSFAFFLLGLGFTAAGRFFSSHQTLFTRAGGIVIILFGMYQLGLFGSGVLAKERRLPFRPDKLAMNPLTALVMGFTFSFAWTPCVGPALASVMILAASATSSGTGFALIGVYTLGFVLPFMAVGFFTGSLLEFLKKHRSAVKYTVKIGGVLMIFIGIMMYTGWMNSISSYLSQPSGLAGTEEKTLVENEPGSQASAAAETDDPAVPAEEHSDSSPADPSPSENVPDPQTAPAEETEPETIPAPDFTLPDQNGLSHSLSDYKGKTVFLNFWATWCPPCRAEMPEIQEIYEEYGLNEEDVVILGVASPNYGQEGSQEEIADFMEKNGYTYPVAMDEGGAVSASYGIGAYPTTFMIDANGNVFGYVSGQLSKDMMQSIIEQTVNGVRQ